LWLLERWLLARAGAPSAPCVFVLGLPRSGASLVYQYLVHRLDLAYFTNGVGRHPDTPASVTHLQRRLRGTYRRDDRYRKVRGPVEPREAGAFWKRIFDHEGYTTLEDLEPTQQQRLRRTLAAIQRSFGGAPFVNKHSEHVLRVDALARVFPDSVFVVVERDLREVALAVYRARRTLIESPASWLSMHAENPRDVETKPVEEQVVAQLTSIQRRLAKDLVSLAPQRVLCIDYDGFCREPDVLAAELARRIGPLGWRNAPVASFAPRHRSPQTASEQRLVNLIGRSD
jgi:hypothetical protein